MEGDLGVLLVEDELLIQAMIQDCLEDAGYAVTTADSGAEAVDLLSDPSLRLLGLVTDINLGPPPDGWDVARRARDLNAELCVVYVSGDSAHNWTRCGVTGSVLIEKPFAPEQVLLALGALVREARARVGS